MERGTKGSGKGGKITESAPKAYAISAYASPGTTTKYSQSSNAQGYRNVAKYNQKDEQTGGYQRYTAREEVTTGEMYRGRGQKEYGVKDEYKTSGTYKVGDKSGYTEYYHEERVRNVSYGGGSRNAGSGGKSIEYGGSNNSNNSYGGGGNNYNYGGGNDYYYDSD